MDNDTSHNDSNPNLDDGDVAQGVKALVIFLIGSTALPLALLVQNLVANVPKAERVPFRILGFDTVSYDDVRRRLLQDRWTAAQIEQFFPRENYFQIQNKFGPTFDIDKPGNESWKSVLHEDAHVRTAQKADGKGGGATPAVSAACFEWQQYEVRAFVEPHIGELTQIREDTLLIDEGVRAEIRTTIRGSTGTGVSLRFAAAVHSLLPPKSEIHIRSIMPEVFNGDLHTYANGFAWAMEVSDAHKVGGGVALRDGKVLKAPFTSVGPVFASDGRVSMSPMDAMHQEAELLAVELRATSQGSLNGRRVDLRDAAPFDADNNPTHIRVATATSIDVIAAGALEFVATRALEQHAAMTLEKFDAWSRTRALSSEEARLVSDVTDDVCKTMSLDLSGLLARIDGQNGSANAFRAGFAQNQTLIASMPAAEVKASIARLPTLVKSQFAAHEANWNSNALDMARDLPVRIREAINARLMSRPHLVEAAIAGVNERLRQISDVARREAEESAKKRDNLSVVALQKIQDTQHAGSFFFGDEPVRNAGADALSTIQALTFARIQQQLREFLVAALVGPLSVQDPEGRTVPAVPVIDGLGAASNAAVAAIRTRLAALVEMVRARADGVGQRVEKRSRVFQRSLTWDGEDKTALDKRAISLVPSVGGADEVVHLIEQAVSGKFDAADIDAAVSGLVIRVPGYVESRRSLEDLVVGDPANLKKVLNLLRNRIRRPFAPIDEQVEEHLGLRNRLDTLVLWELPGGRAGRLAAILKREQIIDAKDFNAIVDSRGDVIRYVYLRDGLPWAALARLPVYRERYQEYMSRPGAVSPHTRRGAHLLPQLEPARTSLRHRVVGLFEEARVLLPQRVEGLPTGGHRIRYTELQSGYRVPADHGDTYERLIQWLCKRADVRVDLQAEIDKVIHVDAGAARGALKKAWDDATDHESRLALFEALQRLGVDPYAQPKSSSSAQ